MTLVFRKYTIFTWFFAISALLPGASGLAYASNVEDEVRLLREQNALLKDQVQKQGTALDTLTKKVEKLEATKDAQTIAAGENPAPASANGYSFGNIHFSAEGGVAFFNTGTEGSTPYSEFRVDEARVFLEAPVWDDV